MKLFRTLVLVFMLLVGATLIVSADPRTGGDAGRPFVAVLLGANEAPGPGDPDGSGLAEITLNQGLGLVCWNIRYTNVDGVTAAHIHRGVAGVPGLVVVPLSPIEHGCTTADPALIQEIRRNPGGFYVNVHALPDFGAGAIRGQLSR